MKSTIELSDTIYKAITTTYNQELSKRIKAGIAAKKLLSNKTTK
jgi:hypothetical protein